MSFTKNADKIPLVKITTGNRKPGRTCAMKMSVIHWEKPGQMQSRYDDHHREEQYNRRVVDAAESLLRTEHFKDKHQGRANDGCGRAINPGSRKAANREHQVARKKDEVCGDANMWTLQSEQ